MADKTQHELVGRSCVMRDLRARIERVAKQPVSVVLLGETGTGKELAARALHRLSGRQGPFIAINCAAVPESMAESTFFGHERGAFTGADRRHIGVIEQADGGTLFLDEIAELPLGLQSKLLRALQEREVVRLGTRDASKPIAVDLRVVVGSHRDLAERIEAKLFRQDLYYRLREYLITLPPLREREDDALELARYFLAKLGPDYRLRRDVARLVRSYSWPGNVRELQSAVRAAAIDANGSSIGAADLRPHLRVALVEPEPPRLAAEERTARLLAAIGDQPRSIGELVLETGVPRSTLRRVLDGLIEQGDVQPVGEGRARRYVRRRAVTGHPCAAEANALRLLEERGVVTRRDFAAASGAALRTANRQLDELVRAGVLRPNGRRGRAAGYVAAD